MIQRYFAIAALLLSVLASAPIVAQSDGEETYTVERYRAFETELEELDLARVVAEPSTEERRLATEAAIQHRRELMTFITGWIREGTLPEAAVPQAREARLVLVENIVQLSVEIGNCDYARASLGLIRGFSQQDDGRQAAYDAAVDAVEACIPYEDPAAVAVEDPSAEDPPAVEPPEQEPVVQDPPELATPPTIIPRPPRRVVDPAGVSLIAAGSAIFIGGVAWNFALLDDRSAYLDDRDDCVRRNTNCDDARSGRSLLSGAKAPVAVLAVGGAVLTAVGAVLQVRANRDQSEDAITVSPTANGVRFTFGRVH